MMKQIDRIEQMVIDLDEQVKQLRSDNAVMDSKLKEMGKQLGVRLKEELNSKQQTQLQEDLVFAREVKDVLKKNAHKSLIEDRTLFSTKHMHTIIHELMWDKQDIHQLECRSVFRVSKYHKDYTKLNVELRTMCKRLVNSGLFTTMKGQQYVPVDPHDINSKPSTSRNTIIIVSDFKKYRDMSASALGGIAKKQQDKALYLLNKRTKEAALAHRSEIQELEKLKKQMVDTEVSFL
jgi:hypothetical protein